MSTFDSPRVHTIHDIADVVIKQRVGFIRGSGIAPKTLLSFFEMRHDAIALLAVKTASG